MPYPKIIVPIAAAIAVAIAVAACGGSDDDQSASQTADTQPQQSQVVAVAEQSQPQQAEPADAPEQAQQPSDLADPADPADQAQADADQGSQEPQDQPAQQQQQSQADDGELRLTYLPRDATHTDEGIPILRDHQRPDLFGFEWATSWNIRLIDVGELGVGAPRDAIPAINSPRYVSIAEAEEYYDGTTPLVQIRVGDDVRGYPLEILIWHEIVNDIIGGELIAVTYCPLCNTAIAFERQVDRWTLDFGVSGLLRNSDLVMYDRQTETLWQQSSGRAIVGALVGARLRYVPASVVSLDQLRTAFPDALILSRDTGFPRDYGRNPYVGYDTPDQRPFLFGGEADPRLPPKARVVSIESDSGATIAYHWDAVTARQVVHDTHDGVDLVIFWTPGATTALGDDIIARAEDIGVTAVFRRQVGDQLLTFVPNPDDAQSQTFRDQETDSTWDIFGRALDGPLAGTELDRVIHSDHFWFAWAAFNPGTEVVAEADLTSTAS